MIMKYFFRGKVALGHEGKVSFLAKEGNYFFPVVVLIVTSLSWERNCSRLLGQCTLALPVRAQESQTGVRQFVALVVFVC